MNSPNNIVLLYTFSVIVIFLLLRSTQSLFFVPEGKYIFFRSILKLISFSESYLFLKLVIVVFISLLGLKSFSLIMSGSVINGEIVAPSAMTELGEKTLRLILSQPLINHNKECCNSDLVSKGRLIEPDIDKVNGNIKNAASSLIQNSDKTLQTISWLKYNNISLDPYTGFRGRFLHHYNTILSPYREVMNGNLLALVSCQYGLISLLPLFLIKDMPFVIYPALGILAFGIFGIWLILRNRKSNKDTIICGIVLILIALSYNMEALRFSAGFSFFRYAPVALILYIYSLNLEKLNFKLILLALLFGVLNSFQFNVLVLLIIATHLFLIWFPKKIPLTAFYLPVAVVCVAIIQFICYQITGNGFQPELFSSVQEGNKENSFAWILIIFPVVLLVSKFIIISEIGLQGLRIESFNNIELLSYISYGALATYAINFHGSPGHYVGFLQMASISIIVMLKHSKTKSVLTFLAVVALVAPGYSYGYLSLKGQWSQNISSFYKYDEKFGPVLYFKSPSKVQDLAQEYSYFIGSHTTDKKIYFISKDKIYIETYLNRNIEPISYDVFVNLQRHTPASANKILKADKVDYLILDNGTHRSEMMRLMVVLKSFISPAEYDSHVKILESINGLAELNNNNLLECNLRYCIYKLK
jgi:hypothetical protein